MIEQLTKTITELRSDLDKQKMEMPSTDSKDEEKIDKEQDCSVNKLSKLLVLSSIYEFINLYLKSVYIFP